MSMPTISNGALSEVRSTHPNGFRSGEWGRILTTVESHGRDCYLIQWADGVTDWWPVVDPSDEREYRAPTGQPC